MGIPIKSWCKNIESNAMEQIVNLTNHPVIKKHVAIMPDCHCGYGMPIGGVIACENAVIPNAVGVDIGCGVNFYKTDIDVGNIGNKGLLNIIEAIKKLIPTGFTHQNKDRTEFDFDNHPDIEIINEEIKSAKRQLGTLGGGNHFIELQKDEDNKLCVMIHSGSRNFGYKIANHYHNIALKLNELYYSNIPHKELAFLPIDSKEGQEYMKCMLYALQFARASRKLMQYKTMVCIDHVLENFDISNKIDIHHNYVAIENHFIKNLYVHRKGAIRMRQGEFGIIPGSMGTPSYIVKGLGNRDSFCSASHGAGRVMGRNQASKTLTEEECNIAMEGIIHSDWGKDRKGNIDLGEAPQAYKNIDDVINNQLDLIEVVKKLQPIAVIKG